MRKCWIWISSVIGRDELTLLVGLGLLTAGVWPVLGVSSLAVPGAIVVWLVLPARLPFVHRPQEPVSRPRRRE